jgi:outer membrane receptor protein involved in Fe transport
MTGTEIDCTNPKEGSLGIDSAFDRPFVVNYAWDSFRDVTSDNMTVDVTWSGESVAVRSITSYTDFESAYTKGSMNGRPGAQGYFDELTESYTQEIQIMSTDNETLEWTLGAYYSDDAIVVGSGDFDTLSYDDHTIKGTDDAGNEITTYHPTALVDPFGGGDFDDGAKYQHIDTITEGLFGQVEWSVMDNVRLIGGIRNNKETKRSEVHKGNSVFDNTDVPFGYGLVGRPLDVYVFPAEPDCQTKVTYDKVTWRAGVEWDMDEDKMFYGNSSNGFLSGGLNSNCTDFDQQDSEAIEIGFKTRWADNKVQINGALYRNEYTNLTAQELIFVPGEGTASGSWSMITLNGGDVSVNGAEIELIWLASEALTITANASVMDAEFGKFGVKNPFQLYDGVKANDTVDANGNPLKGFVSLDGTTPGWSPDTTMGMTVAYDHDMGSSGVLTTYLQFYYSDSYNTDDVSLYSTQVQDSYTKTDLRLTWTSADEHFSVSGFVENIEDEVVLSRTNTGSDDLVQGSYAFPRNAGVKLSYRY